MKLTRRERSHLILSRLHRYCWSKIQGVYDSERWSSLLDVFGCLDPIRQLKLSQVGRSWLRIRWRCIAYLQIPYNSLLQSIPSVATRSCSRPGWWRLQCCSNESGVKRVNLLFSHFVECKNFQQGKNSIGFSKAGSSFLVGQTHCRCFSNSQNMRLLGIVRFTIQTSDCRGEMIFRTGPEVAHLLARRLGLIHFAVGVGRRWTVRYSYHTKSSMSVIWELFLLSLYCLFRMKPPTTKILKVSKKRSSMQKCFFNLARCVLCDLVDQLFRTTTVPDPCGHSASMATGRDMKPVKGRGLQRRGTQVMLLPVQSFTFTLELETLRL